MDKLRDEAIRLLAEAGDEDLQVAGPCLQAEPAACRAAAFHAQQAAEKYIKARLVALGEDEPPITHSLARVAGLLVELGGPAMASEPLRYLTRFAVGPRYGRGDVSPVDARRAVGEATRIVATCRQTIAAVRRED